MGFYFYLKFGHDAQLIKMVTGISDIKIAKFIK